MAHKNGEPKMLTAIGLMSGTSMDGIDVALIRTNGRKRIERGPSASWPYDPEFRAMLEQALIDARQITNRDERPASLAAVERELTIRHAAAVNAFLSENAIPTADVDLIGFHGQTVLHRPQDGLTVQLGDGRLLARQTAMPVVYDMRANDMRHGGQGAPLVPVYHRALAQNLPEPWSGIWPVAFVNIGGIANITLVERKGGLLAFDTGPGNALIDQWVQGEAGIPFDQGGAIASEGQVSEDLVAQYMSSSYFSRKPPKSLDRNDFPVPKAGSMSLHDGARTLAHVTAASIYRATDHLPEKPGLWIVCGGGRHNRLILEDLARLAADDEAIVITADQAGLDGDAMEAEAWAYLAVRAARKLKLTWPGTTGVDKPRSGGRRARPKRQKNVASFPR
ncbi:MAG: anhydro-N-acetylmuramic acid kinase [Rhizobiaceae bacterium]